MKNKLLVCLSLASILWSTVAVLVAIAPHEFRGATGIEKADFDVAVSSNQPITIKMSHVFRLIREDYFSQEYFYVEDGVLVVNYTIKVTGPSGTDISTIEGAIMAPERYGFYKNELATNAVVYVNHALTLSPGKYTLWFNAEHELSYEVIQLSRFDALFVISLLIGSFALFGAIFLVHAGYKKWAEEKGYLAEKNSRLSFQPNTLNRSLERPFPGNGTGQTCLMTPEIARDLDAARHICVKCGHSFQTRPVQGVVTCDNCGEKEYVG